MGDGPGEHELLLAEAERRRIAEGLHDGPIQWLASASLQVATMLRSGEPDPERLESVQDILGRAIGSLRHMMFALHPPDVDASDLEAAISSVAEWALADSGLALDVDVDLPQPIEDESLRRVLVQLVQEAVINARTHAVGATAIAVTIDERDGVVRLRVSDDGADCDPDGTTSRPGHVGLHIMRSRAEAIGGSFEISASVGSGTTVAADLPRRI